MISILSLALGFCCMAITRDYDVFDLKVGKKWKMNISDK